jgi:hypothetical protein
MAGIKAQRVDRGEEDPVACRKRELARARKRRHRMREKEGELVLDVPLKNDFVTWALDHGYVDDCRAWDRQVLAGVARRIIEKVIASVPAVTRPSVTVNNGDRPDALSTASSEREDRDVQGKGQSHEPVRS